MSSSKENGKTNNCFQIGWLSGQVTGEKYPLIFNGPLIVFSCVYSVCHGAGFSDGEFSFSPADPSF
jgi:hypothetical protein